MAFPKPRKLVVDQIAYNWTCSQELLVDRNLPAGEDHLYSESRLYVETRADNSIFIEAVFDSRPLYGYGYRIKYFDYLAITPAVVSAVIRYVQAAESGKQTENIIFTIKNGRKRISVQNASLVFNEELREALKKGSKWGPPPELS
ncbi:MAG: hypothetical protein OEZ34_09260 [Spirochaetia bacterium]|nr:hypothetical protein [Spirochaetia bacterium]